MTISLVALNRGLLKLQYYLKVDSKFAAVDWRIALGSHCVQPNWITIDCPLKCAYYATAVHAWLALSSICLLPVRLIIMLTIHKNGLTLIAVAFCTCKSCITHV